MNEDTPTDDGAEIPESLGEPTIASPVEPVAPLVRTAPSESAPTPPSRHFLVPKWAGYVVAGLVLVAGGFGIGWIVAPGHSEHDVGSTRQYPRGMQNDGRGDGRFLPSPTGAYLGVAAQSPSSGSGAQIVRVASESPADDAGLEPDDVITKVDDQTVDSPAQLVQRVRAHEAGDEVTIAYTRGDDAKTVKVKLGDRSSVQSQLRPAMSGPDGSGLGSRSPGF